MKHLVLGADGGVLAEFKSAMEALNFARTASLEKEAKHEATIYISSSLIMIFGGGRELFGCMKAYSPFAVVGILESELPKEYVAGTYTGGVLYRQVASGDFPFPEGE